jgi:ABC-2 type transport system ATP-binding protein
MTGYLEPSRGSVEIDGSPFTPDSVDAKRKIGYLPESAPAYADMIAWDYLAYEARLHGVDVASRVPEVIRLVGLDSHAHMPIRALSKGYRQRLGLAHTLIHDPELLVLDEPTSGLDPNQIVEVRSLIRSIAETKTVVLSTHIMQEVEAMCDRVIVIHRGRLRFDGAIDDFDARGDVQRIRCTAGGIERERLEDSLREIDGVRDVRSRRVDDAEDERSLIAVEIVADAGDDARPRVFRHAAERGFDIYELYRVRTSMEEVFRHLTQGDQHDEE